MSLTLSFLAFLAGLLTVLAPCSLPLLPIIIGGSAAGKGLWRPLTITLSLGVSVLVFTLLLKVFFGLLPVSLATWRNLSGVLIILMGCVYLFPQLWDWLSLKLKLADKSDSLLNRAGQKPGLSGAILVGASLGPVFSSCSPTYAILLATVFPSSFWLGLAYMLLYVLGLSLMLFLVAFWGQYMVQKLKWAANPGGWFRKIIGLIFILVGVAGMVGWGKKTGGWVGDRLPFAFTEIEQELLEGLETPN